MCSRFNGYHLSHKFMLRVKDLRQTYMCCQHGITIPCAQHSLDPQIYMPTEFHSRQMSTKCSITIFRLILGVMDIGMVDADRHNVRLLYPPAHMTNEHACPEALHTQRRVSHACSWPSPIIHMVKHCSAQLLEIPSSFHVIFEIAKTKRTSSVL